MDIINIKLIGIPESLDEIDFPGWITMYGWNCLWLTRPNFEKINIVLKDRGFPLIESLAAGRPDFFIWNDNETIFCEFKSPGDYLRNNQLGWFINNPEYKGAIAIVHANPKKALEGARDVF